MRVVFIKWLAARWRLRPRGREKKKDTYSIIHINLSLQSLYLLKKTASKSIRSFKDLSIHRDIGTDRESDFVLYYEYVVMIQEIIFHFLVYFRSRLRLYVIHDNGIQKASPYPVFIKLYSNQSFCFYKEENYFVFDCYKITYIRIKWLVSIVEKNSFNPSSTCKVFIYKIHITSRLVLEISRGYVPFTMEGSI